MYVNDALISTAPQVLFDHVVEGLVLQGRKSSQECTGGEPGRQCVYRTEDGLRCALGHCFTVSMHAYIEADSGSIDVLQANQTITGLSLHLQNFLGSLQKAHDESRHREGWVSRMQEVAQDYDLNPARLVKLADPAWASVDIW